MTNLKFPHRFESRRPCITPILLLKRERGARNLVLLSLSLGLWSLLTCRIQSLRECLCRCLLIHRIVLFAFLMRTLLFSFEIDLSRKNLDCRFFRVRFLIGNLHSFVSLFDKKFHFLLNLVEENWLMLGSLKLRMIEYFIF